MDCKIVESIGGRLVCSFDRKLNDFLFKFLSSSDSYAVITAFSQLVLALAAIFVIVSLIIYIYKLPTGIFQLLEMTVIALVAGFVVNVDFILGFIDFVDDIQIGLSEAFMLVSNPDLKINHSWDLYQGIDGLVYSSFSLVRWTWNVSRAFFGDVGWLDVLLALLLALFTSILYLTFSIFLLIAIAGKYIFAALFPFVMLASIIPPFRYIFKPWLKQFISFFFIVPMLALMMGITSHVFNSLSSESGFSFLGEQSIFSQYDSKNTELNKLLKDSSSNKTRIGTLNSELAVLSSQIEDSITKIFSTNVFWSIMLVVWIAIFYHLRASDWISLIIGSQAVSGAGSFIASTVGAAGAAAGTVAHYATKPADFANKLLGANQNSNMPGGPNTVGGYAMQGAKAPVRTVREALGR